MLVLEHVPQEQLGKGVEAASLVILPGDACAHGAVELAAEEGDRLCIALHYQAPAGNGAGIQCDAPVDGNAAAGSAPEGEN